MRSHAERGRRYYFLPRNEFSLGDFARVGQIAHEVHLAAERFHQGNVEADDPQRVVSQLHVEHVEIQVHVGSEPAGVSRP